MAGSIWKGAISFGLLNIPVTLQKAQEDRDLSFKMLDERDHSPIKYKRVSAKDGKEVPWDRIVKGYEYEKGQYVTITKDDLKAANPRASGAIEIEDFVEFDDIDLMFLDRPYYLVPQSSGLKGYFLLVEALKKTNKVAIGKIVIRTRQHLAMIMPKDSYLILEILRFGHEVLDVHEVDYLDKIERPKFSSKELKMAEELIEGMAAQWNPDQYKDSYTDDVMKMIKTKIKSGEVRQIDWKIPEEERGNTGKVVDLMPLLRKSLAEKKKRKKPSQVKSRVGKKKSVRKRAS